MATATLLLPARHRFPATALPAPVARALGQAERETLQPGEHAQLQRHFQLPGQQWPVAALTRQLDAGDAGDRLWLRADPANITPDMNGARMMAFGELLASTADDVAQLLPALQELFVEHGFVLQASDPARWYLQLPPDTALPAFATPSDVLGDDVFAHLPAGEQGRPWRALLSETQVLLHNHPWNAQRVANGQRPINSLWFWGAGVLPRSVSTPHAQVRSRDALVRALASVAGVAVDGDGAVDALVDLRQLRSVEQLGQGAITPLLEALRRGELRELVLDFEDGACFRIQRSQRWRLWRKPVALHD